MEANGVTEDEKFRILSRGSVFSVAPDELSRQLDLLDEAKKLESQKPKWMIDPESVYKLIWDWTVIGFVLYSTVELPVDIAFFDLKCKEIAAPRSVLDHLLLICLNPAAATNEDQELFLAYRTYTPSHCKPLSLKRLGYFVR